MRAQGFYLLGVMVVVVGIIFASGLFTSALFISTTSVVEAQNAIGACGGCLPPKQTSGCYKPCIASGCTGSCYPGNICYGGNATCKDGSQASPDGLEKLAGLVQKALMALMPKPKMGGGMPMPENPLEQKEDPNSAADLLKKISEEDIKSPFDVLSGAFGSETQAETEIIAENTRTTVELITDTVKNIGDVLKNATGVSFGEGEITPTGSGEIRENVSSNTNVEQTDRGITFRTEVVDEEANTGVGSFFGSSVPDASSEAQRSSLVGRLCTAQPWETSFVSRIFSSRFFDSMCENRGYVPGGQGAEEEVVKQPIQESTFIDERLGEAQIKCPRAVILGDMAEIEWTCGAALRSSGIGFETNGWPTGSTSVTPLGDTTYTLECSQGGTASCTVGAIGPDIQIVAHPQRVPLGARTRLYWVGENVVECQVSGPGLNENSLRGAATTEAILDQTEFTLTCETEGGSVVNAKTTVDVGI